LSSLNQLTCEIKGASVNHKIKKQLKEARDELFLFWLKKGKKMNRKTFKTLSYEKPALLSS
jgi:hypothetical protein